MSMSTFNNLRDANVARQTEWAAGATLSIHYKGNELAGEVGEACNVIKKLDREALGMPGSRDTYDHLGEELADVIICVDLLAMEAGHGAIEPLNLSGVYPLNLSAGGNLLAAKAGLVNQMIEEGDHQEGLHFALRELVTATHLMARQVSIDLDVVVQSKFNATSEKVGLKTRLAA